MVRADYDKSHTLTFCTASPPVGLIDEAALSGADEKSVSDIPGRIGVSNSHIETGAAMTDDIFN